MEEKLHIKLLGMFRITFAGDVISDATTLRLQEFLAWLLLHQKGPQNRQHLSYIFWPDSRESQAKNNLRNILHLLRKELPQADYFIIADHATLKWNPDSNFTLDLDQFKKAIADAKLSKDPVVREAKLTEGISLYGGPLLPDCYSDWIEEFRGHVKQDYLFALKELTELAQTNRNYQNGIHIAKMWTRDDPFNEQAWRALIRLYALNNDRANALLAYKKCAKTLRNELHIEPASETLDLYDQVINNYREIDRPTRRTSIRRPNKKQPLIGRDYEWKQLLGKWKNVLSKQIEFSLIEGNSGIGKTYLSTEFANFISKQGYPVIYTKCHKTTKEIKYGTLAVCLKQDVLYGHIDQVDDAWKTPLVRLLPELLSNNPELKPPDPDNKPEEQYKLLEGVSKIFQAVDKPMLLFIDDLHWCDAETLCWISYYLQQNESAPLYFLGTLDNDEIITGSTIETFISAHRNENYLTQLTLNSFDLNQTAELISAISSQPTDTPTVQKIYNSSLGVPGKIVDTVQQDSQGTKEPESTDTHTSPESITGKHHGPSLSDNNFEKKANTESVSSHYPSTYTRVADRIHKRFETLKDHLKYPYVFLGLILTTFFIQYIDWPLLAAGDTEEYHTIGVLPFSNLSDENTDGALTLGMVDILSNNLAQSDKFKVISHKSVSSYLGQYSQSRMVQELDLDFLIEGSVQTSDEQIRINVQLMDAQTSQYIWTNTYERYLGDVFFLQKELTIDILAKVNTVLGQDAEPELAIRTERVNPEAFKYFMQSKSLEGEETLSLLKQSIAIDSTFSPAYAHLAIVYAFQFAFTQSEDYRQKSQQAINKVLILNPNSSLVYLAKAMLSEFSFDWDNAEKAFQKTIELNPLNEIAHHELAQLQMRLGRFQEAIESEKRAIYLAPNSYEYQNGLGEIYLFQRDYDKAILEMNKALQLNADHHPSYRWLSKVYMFKQDYIKALEYYDIYSKMSGKFDDPSNFPGGLAQIYGYMGQKQKALDLINTFLENNSVETINTFLMLQLALTYTSINDVENALMWLEKGQKANAGWLIYMKIQPGFDLLRNNPRYQALEKQIYGKYSII